MIPRCRCGHWAAEHSITPAGNWGGCEGPGDAWDQPYPTGTCDCPKYTPPD